MTRWAYYNEIDPFALDWLRRLVKAGSLPDGCIDHRSITLVQPDDLREFHEVHLFAGIGIWAKALRLADFPADVPVWTGSCPCQPYSVAGEQGGEADERHLWPEMHRLLADRLPPIVFGEQVSGGAGVKWLAGVRGDLEAARYAVGAADLTAAGVGAPHVRQRLYWGANRLAYSDAARLQIQRHRELQRTRRREEGRAVEPSPGHTLPTWGDTWITLPDGTLRRSQPGLRLVADAGDAQGRVGRIQAYGNAVVPALAAAFIRSFTLAC